MIMVANFTSDRASNTEDSKDWIKQFNQSAFARLQSVSCSEFERKRIRARLAKHNEGLVKFVVERMSENLPESLEELILVGRTGLTKAINNYNPCKGAAFSSFAIPYIRGAVRHHMRDRARLIRISQTDQEIKQRIDKVEAIYRKHGKQIDRLAIAQNLHKIDPAKINDDYLEELERMNSREYVSSLDVTADEDSPGIQIAAPEPDQDLDLYRKLPDCINRLRYGEYVCIRGVYWQGMSEMDIALDYGWAVEQVQGYLKSAIAKLKTELEDLV